MAISTKYEIVSQGDIVCNLTVTATTKEFRALMAELPKSGQTLVLYDQISTMLKNVESAVAVAEALKNAAADK